MDGVVDGVVDGLVDGLVDGIKNQRVMRKKCAVVGDKNLKKNKKGR